MCVSLVGEGRRGEVKGKLEMSTASARILLRHFSESLGFGGGGFGLGTEVPPSGCSTFLEKWGTAAKMRSEAPER